MSSCAATTPLGLGLLWRLAGIWKLGGIQLAMSTSRSQRRWPPDRASMTGPGRNSTASPSVGRSKGDQLMRSRRQLSRRFPTLRSGQRERGLAQLQAARVGAAAVGAAAVGAGALGALAIGRLAVGRAVVRRLKIEELEVTRLHVHQLRVDEQPTT